MRAVYWRIQFLLDCLKRDVGSVYGFDWTNAGAVDAIGWFACIPEESTSFRKASFVDCTRVRKSVAIPTFFASDN